MPRQSCHSSSFPPLSSFPRKRESRPPDATGIYRKNRNPRHRHSRESGSVEAAEKFGADGLWFAAKDPLIQVLRHDLPERA
ncbi:hypothetical protein E4V92_09840, partial [Neisseria meningitidis]|nr:hypothetical protein [Neisseria meningitidis]